MNVSHVFVNAQMLLKFSLQERLPTPLLQILKNITGRYSIKITHRVKAANGGSNFSYFQVTLTCIKHNQAVNPKWHFEFNLLIFK